ncbi:MAG TPA: tetraacyldisaccharide 4'-kinase [Terriglobales bacterium]
MTFPSILYGSGIKLRNALYDGRILSAHRLRGAVVSVGNLSVGGAGKTPFVILLGELLKQRNIPFDILSRGYGRSSRGVALVDPAGTPQQFGDEPLLLSQRLRVPVIVGENRYEAGVFAEKKFGSQLHILDDGFQHRSLARDFDIVLLSAEDTAGDLLPNGRLREPLTALSRADAVVASDDVPLDLIARPGLSIWSMGRGIAPLSAPKRPLAFCGIARPQNFFDQLRRTGVDPVGEKSYRDHHAYSLADAEHLIALARQVNADGFVTTEKDRINLGTLASLLNPLAIAVVRMDLAEPNQVVDALLRTVRERKRVA